MRTESVFIATCVCGKEVETPKREVKCPHCGRILDFSLWGGVMTAESLAAALHGKPCGNGYYRALCPAHEDKSPSLAIGTGKNGKVIVKCWSGCTQEAVIEALRDMGLWNAAPKPQVNERLAARATAWRTGMIAFLEERLATYSQMLQIDAEADLDPSAELQRRIKECTAAIAELRGLADRFGAIQDYQKPALIERYLKYRAQDKMLAYLCVRDGEQWTAAAASVCRVALKVRAMAG